MKTLIAIALSLALISAEAQTNTNENVENQPNNAVMGCIIVGLTLAAGYYIWTIYTNPVIAGSGRYITVILYQSRDMVSWTPVSTNSIMMTGRGPDEILRKARDECDDPCLNFRVKVVK